MTTRGLGTALGVAIAGLIYTAAVHPSSAASTAAAARPAVGDLPLALASHGLTVTLLALSAIAIAAATALLGGSKSDGGEYGAGRDRPGRAA